jgi:hypothetical protein
MVDSQWLGEKALPFVRDLHLATVVLSDACDELLYALKFANMSSVSIDGKRKIGKFAAECKTYIEEHKA